MSRLMSTGDCSCGEVVVHSKLSESGHYSFDVALHFVRAMKAWTRAFLKEGKAI